MCVCVFLWCDPDNDTVSSVYVGFMFYYGRNMRYIECNEITLYFIVDFNVFIYLNGFSVENNFKKHHFYRIIFL